jgi:hypothetical protein
MKTPGWTTLYVDNPARLGPIFEGFGNTDNNIDVHSLAVS